MRCGSGDAVGAVGKALPLVYPEREYVRSEEKGGGAFFGEAPLIAESYSPEGKRNGGSASPDSEIKVFLRVWK